MANEWTTEYPTQPGYYWVKNRVIKHGELPTPCVVVVTPCLSFYEAGVEVMFDKAEILSAEWFGPIRPPQEEDAIRVAVNADEDSYYGIEPQQQENDDYEWNDATGCSFDKSWCSARATHHDPMEGRLCDHHWKWEQIYKKREAKAQENDK